MTHKGIPDGSRAARLILKDYVSGKLALLLSTTWVVNPEDISTVFLLVLIIMIVILIIETGNEETITK